MEEEIIIIEDDDIEEIDIEEENYSGKPYELPVASKDVLGGIKVGKNLEIEEDGTLNAKASESVDLTEYVKEDELKTINGQSLIGEGNIVIKGGIGDALPINAIFEYEGDVVPEGYVEVEPSSSGGSSEIISLDEQVIGKDKDGKILYKKTILSTVNIETSIKYEDTNIYRVVDWSANAYNDTNTLKLPHFMIEPDGTIPYVQAWWNKWNGSTRLYARCTNHYEGYILEVIVKYTKKID